MQTASRGEDWRGSGGGNTNLRVDIFRISVETLIQHKKDACMMRWLIVIVFVGVSFGHLYCLSWCGVVAVYNCWTHARGTTNLRIAVDFARWTSQSATHSASKMFSKQLHIASLWSSTSASFIEAFKTWIFQQTGRDADGHWATEYRWCCRRFSTLP